MSVLRQALAATLVTLAWCCIWADTGRAQATYYDRSEIPGNYSLGLYADPAGRSSTVKLEGDQNVIEAYLGATGDSTRVFSGAAFGLDLPDGVEVEGAFRWNTIPGLTQWGSPVGEGIRLEFPLECQVQDSAQPLMLGRVRFAVDDNFRSGQVVVRGHQKYDLSVELCAPEGDWPKPFATAVNLTIERKRSLWGKIQDIFQ